MDFVFVTTSTYHYFEIIIVIIIYIAGEVKGADVTSVLDMDSQQYSFDSSLIQLDSAELAAFGTALSENLSSGLFISDSPKVFILHLILYIHLLYDSTE